MAAVPRAQACLELKLLEGPAKRWKLCQVAPLPPRHLSPMLALQCNVSSGHDERSPPKSGTMHGTPVTACGVLARAIPFTHLLCLNLQLRQLTVTMSEQCGQLQHAGQLRHAAMLADAAAEHLREA